MRISLNAVFRRRADVRFRRFQNESVVVKQSAGEVLVLNGVGGRLLELTDGSSDLARVVEQLEEEYEVDRETLVRDVEHFARELEGAGLIERLSENKP